MSVFFFFNDTAATEIYTYGHTLSLHDALPIFLVGRCLADELAMLAHVPAVVGGVHDVGVVELAGLAQRRDHAGNEVIDRLQHGEAAAVDLVDGGELPEIGRAHV